MQIQMITVLPINSCLQTPEEQMFQLICLCEFRYNLESFTPLSLSRRTEGYFDYCVCLNSQFFYIQLPLSDAEQAKSLSALSLSLQSHISSSEIFYFLTGLRDESQTVITFQKVINLPTLVAIQQVFLKKKNGSNWDYSPAKCTFSLLYRASALNALILSCLRELDWTTQNVSIIFSYYLRLTQQHKIITSVFAFFMEYNLYFL